MCVLSFAWRLTIESLYGGHPPEKSNFPRPSRGPPFGSLKCFSVEDSVVARHMLALVLDVADLRVEGLVLIHLGIRAQVQAVEAATQRLVLCKLEQLPADPVAAQMREGGYCVDVEALCCFVLNERADDRVLVLRDPDMTVLGVCVEVEQHRRWRPADPSDTRAEGLYDALACGRSIACKCLTDDQVQVGPPVLVVTASSPYPAELARQARRIGIF